MTVLHTARSLLFVPGHRPDRFDKAASSGADVVVVEQDTSVRPWLSTTSTLRSSALSTAVVPMWAPAGTGPPTRGSSATVTANPTTAAGPHTGRMPPTPAGSPSARQWSRNTAPAALSATGPGRRQNVLLKRPDKPVDIPLGRLHSHASRAR